MRIRFLVIFIVFAVAGLCFAKDKQPKPVKPVYKHSEPARIKPVFEKAQFERGSRVRSAREKSSIEKPQFTKRQIERPVFDTQSPKKPDWDKSVIETKWSTDSQEVFTPTPIEKKSDSKVKRGWFRKLRDP
ncbi:MAG: hypothetical protein H0X66_11345 [Verrucomicrobia bacterium]|nr:hypothetical protein [Verrucomicrobiota bacterium]